MKSEANEVSVVIVNYKSWTHLSDCLISLMKISSANFGIEIIVVDNHSNDGVLEEFKVKFNKVCFIENIANNGFSNACNLGAQNARGNYILFLNPDTIVLKDAILKLLVEASKNSDYGILSCNLLRKDGSEESQIRFLPKILTLFGFLRGFYKLVNKNKLKNQFNHSKNIVFPEWVSGAVVFMSKIWYEKVGGWNEDYWMYYEDVDLCKKVQDLGGKIVLLRDVSIVHNHGGASRLNVRTSALTKTEVIISKHVYIRNHFKGFFKKIAFFLVILEVFFTKIFVGILGILLFFVPKLYLRWLIFKNIISYYLMVMKNKTWLSRRSMNFI